MTLPTEPKTPEPDVRTPKDGDEVVQQQDDELDNPLESIGKAISAPVFDADDDPPPPAPGR